MTYYFFADAHDKLEVLKFIFNETDLHIYDLGSPYGEKICEYKTVEELVLKNDINYQATFQLWSPLHKGKPIFRKVNLDPKRCKGHTFRYATEGVGLVQLYFGGVTDTFLL